MNHAGKHIRDVIEWLPPVWAGAVGRPNATRASIDEVVVRRGIFIRLTVTDEGRMYTTSIEVADDGLRSRIVEMLARATDKTLSDAGGLSL